MLALVAAPSRPGGIELREVAEPLPEADQAVVAVEAVSLNRGEVKAVRAAPDGTRAGWDVAGTVLNAAADGSGPREGARVVGLVSATGWAQRAAVPTGFLAPIPDALSTTAAATLPVAGLTALHTLYTGGLTEAKRVLVTGVGRRRSVRGADRIALGRDGHGRRRKRDARCGSARARRRRRLDRDAERRRVRHHPRVGGR